MLRQFEQTIDTEVENNIIATTNSQPPISCNYHYLLNLTETLYITFITIISELYLCTL
jgi:hypothetical protein